MVKVIMGVKGTGKTKQMIELINSAAKNEAGNVVCIEYGSDLTYDLDYKIRLIEAGEYNLNSLGMLEGFVSGLHAGNYDITKVFIESLTKLVDISSEDPQIEQFLSWLEGFGEKNGIEFIVSISADSEQVPEGIKKFL